jgi:Tfp pilus assembly protein PilP
MAYTARLGTAIGVNGTVASVSEENVIVRQSVRDIFGEEKIREVELNL